MPDVLYVGLQEDDKIVASVSTRLGQLVPNGRRPSAGRRSSR
jgi:hypothetical protein